MARTIAPNAGRGSFCVFAPDARISCRSGIDYLLEKFRWKGNRIRLDMDAMAETENKPDGAKSAAPVVVLVEPQLGQNIGMAARAMGNFGLSELRIVNPRDGWPNIHASRAASGADAVIDGARLFDSVAAAIADCSLVFATTARAHDQAKPVLAPESAVREMAGEIAGEGRVAILFGRERWGLTNEEVALADRIVTFPVDPEFASLNLAQAVLLMGYEWFKCAKGGVLPYAATERSVRASKQQEQAFFDTLVAELDRVEFLRPPEKRDTMIVNLRNIFSRMEPTKQDMQTLHGAIKAIAEGSKGPARGGVLDSDEALRLRALLATTGAGRMPDEQGPVRGLARLLRRNTSDAERVLWKSLTRDRRFAGQFKRQTPVGRQIPDFVSFVHRLAIELIAESEPVDVGQDRSERRAWLEQRDYRVVDIREADVTGDLESVLAALEKYFPRSALS